MYNTKEQHLQNSGDTVCIVLKAQNQQMPLKHTCRGEQQHNYLAVLKSMQS